MYVSDGFWHAVDAMHEPSVTKTLGASLARSRRAVPEPEVRRAALVRVIREPLAVRRPERIRATNHARSLMRTQEVVYVRETGAWKLGSLSFTRLVGQ
jgi:hypothetical protein